MKKIYSTPSIKAYSLSPKTNLMSVSGSTSLQGTSYGGETSKNDLSGGGDVREENGTNNTWGEW